MCGICGYFNYNHNEPVKPEVIRRMCQTLVHRGPDDEGVFVSQKIGLGHRRLSIIDLSTGRQPIFNEDGSLAIVFNGEIYNFLELRSWLEKKGHTFSTRTDTESIIHLYEEFGVSCLEKLNGMFALAIWDSKRQELFLARDRFGKKPLHFVKTDQSFIFASEIKSLLVHPAVKREVDPESLAYYLTYEYVPAPHCLFRGIRKLMAGHFLLCSAKGIKEEKYWEFSFSREKTTRSEYDWGERIRDSLRLSIKRRLISDVPLGVFLSGGIDSSAIVALMSELKPASEIKTFSIGFEDRSFDETAYARKVAILYHTDHHEQILNARKMLELIFKLEGILDEPMADASIIPTYLLSRFTREYVTVALGGDGGDELFAGYPTFPAHRLAGFYEYLPRFLHEKLIKKLAECLPVSTSNISFDFKVKQFLSGVYHSPEIRNELWLGAFSSAQLKSLLSPEMASQLKDFNPFAEMLTVLEPLEARDWLEKIIHLYIRFYFQNGILVKIDRASMASSLEVRSPFLDPEFVELIGSIPGNLKLKGLTTKYILKKSLEPVLPGEIIYRDKKGFGIPIARWIKEDLRDHFLDVFSQSSIEHQGFFKFSAVNNLMMEHLQGKRDNRKKLWTLFMFQLWYQNWFK